jgi:SPX domain protein involved in polyphosphate accumulation
MQKCIFSRYERKYLVTTEQKDEIVSYLKNYMIDDPFSRSGSHYTIYNVYFDTPDYSVIRQSVLKPIYKSKLRLRSYKAPLDDCDQVFLEIKTKFEGRVNKRRVVMTYKVAMDYIEKGIKPQFTHYLDNQIMNEIDYHVKIYELKPGSFISYERTALMTPDDQLRVTFDHNILFRNDDVHMNNISGHPILSDANQWLMEVKSEDNFPLWLAKKLSQYELFSQGFSKYGKAYQMHLLGGFNDEPILY